VRAHRLIIGSIGLVLVGLGVCAALWLAGSVVVLDPGGEAVSASLVASGAPSRALHRLPGGAFYGVPGGGKGEIEIRCRNGAGWRGDYVTAHMNTWVRLEPGSGCGRVAPVR